MNNQILLLVFSATAFSQAQEMNMGRRVSKTLKFISPLQSLTLFPKEIPTTTPREEFVPKFKAGLGAEKKAREEVLKKNDLLDDPEFVGKGWEKRSEEMESLRSEREDQFVEKSYDEAIAIAGFDEVSPANLQTKGSNFQFVGVVQPLDAEKKVQWYARKRPSNSKWNMRLLHVDKGAIMRDMFVHKKIDVFAKYANTGKPRDAPKEGEDPSAPRRPLIEAEYNIKKRSLLNLWNFSPKHFFTDSSGAFWRERRLTPGLYTDGSLVYEQKYRYVDGKNGMKPISKLDALLRSKAIKDTVKTDLLKRLNKDAPDVVIEN